MSIIIFIVTENKEAIHNHCIIHFINVLSYLLTIVALSKLIPKEEMTNEKITLCLFFYLNVFVVFIIPS